MNFVQTSAKRNFFTRIRKILITFCDKNGFPGNIIRVAEVRKMSELKFWVSIYTANNPIRQVTWHKKVARTLLYFRHLSLIAHAAVSPAPIFTPIGM